MKPSSFAFKEDETGTLCHNDTQRSLKLYLSKLNPKCEALFQLPQYDWSKVDANDQCWYQNHPLSINTYGQEWLIAKSAIFQVTVIQQVCSTKTRSPQCYSTTNAVIFSRQVLEQISRHNSFKRQSLSQLKVPATATTTAQASHKQFCNHPW